MESKYQKVVAAIKNQIASDSLAVGQKIPSLRSLCETFGVSLITTVKALDVLIEEGWVESFPKSGFRVIAKPLSLSSPESFSSTSLPQNLKSAEKTEVFLNMLGKPGLVNLGAASLSRDLIPEIEIKSALREAVRIKSDLSFSYGDPAGEIDLRRAIARRLQSFGAIVQADHVVTTHGALEGIRWALRAFLKKGDIVAVESPTYFGFLNIIEELDLKAVPLAVTSDGLDWKEFESKLRNLKIKCFIASFNFSNPYGHLFSKEHRIKMLDLAVKYDFSIIESDVYGDLAHGKERPQPLGAIRHKAHVIYVGSVSKSLAPGLRTGWVVSSNLAERIKFLKFSNIVASGQVQEIAVAHILKSRSYEKHLQRIRPQIANCVKHWSKILTEQLPRGSRVHIPSGGFLVWIQLPDHIDSEMIQKRLLTKNIAIAPGTMFSIFSEYRNYFRLTCATGYPQSLNDSIKILLNTIGNY
jgi:DNA-binding transcriptional MocR family regulator